MTTTIHDTAGRHCGFIMTTLRADKPHFGVRRLETIGQYFSTKEEAINYVKGSSVIKERLNPSSTTA